MVQNISLIYGKIPKVPNRLLSKRAVDGGLESALLRVTLWGVSCSPPAHLWLFTWIISRNCISSVRLKAVTKSPTSPCSDTVHKIKRMRRVSFISQGTGGGQKWWLRTGWLRDPGFLSLVAPPSVRPHRPLALTVLPWRLGTSPTRLLRPRECRGFLCTTQGPDPETAEISAPLSPAQPVRWVGLSACSLGTLTKLCAWEDTAGEQPTHLSLRTFYPYFSVIFKFQLKKLSNTEKGLQPN